MIYQINRLLTFKLMKYPLQVISKVYFLTINQMKFLLLLILDIKKGLQIKKKVNKKSHSLLVPEIIYKVFKIITHK